MEYAYWFGNVKARDPFILVPLQVSQSNLISVTERETGNNFADLTKTVTCLNPPFEQALKIGQ